MEERLQKILASTGLASRRGCEVYITAGRVKVNGKVITKFGTKVNPKKDEVDILGEKPLKKGKNIYIALNKPVDYITTTTSAQGASVIDLLVKENNIKPKFGVDVKERVYPVGRLDKDSEGLVLLTNDGELTNKLTHPRYEHTKLYEVTIDKPLTRDAKDILTKGMTLGDKRVKGIKITNESIRGKRTVVTVVLHEGKNRQVRKMFGRLGYSITGLKRIQMAKLTIGTLPPGRWRFVKKENIV